ncbi:MAG: glycosyltransferase, partial [Clostridia bacterium]|nr:glycosyltransferase [Clostridia bacterium]
MTEMVSIIMPIYNAASTRVAAVSCIMGQTGENWELLLINDGSTDKSGELCDRLAGEDSRIRVFHQENRGA